MKIDSPLFVLGIYLIAFATAFFFRNTKYSSIELNRNSQIDGLRGLLGIGVFCHHSIVWYQFLKEKTWHSPESYLAIHLGETSVSFFFMITAYLFFTKITKGNITNWNHFFISRFLRLFPVYLISVILIIINVFILSNWKIKVTFLQLLYEISCWVAFTIPGVPIINNCTITNLINAGIAWSLPYEWMFYFSLPLFSLLLRKKTVIIYCIFSLIFTALYFTFKVTSVFHIASFLGGAVSPFIFNYFSKKINFESNIFSIIIVICFLAITYFKTSNDFTCKFLTIIIFNLIVLGNSIFGLLKNPTLKILSEISYSTYIFHGIIIFDVLNFVIGIEEASKFNNIQYSLLIFSITPVVVILSYFSFEIFEKPFMKFSKYYFKK